MTFAWDLGLIAFILSISLITIFYILVLFVMSRVVKRTEAYIAFGITAGSVYFSYIFNLTLVLYVSIAASLFVIIISLYSNLGDLRNYLANPFKKQSGRISNSGEKIYNRERLIDIINETVMILSKNKTGALITFEKKVSLDDFFDNGVSLDCPVSSELLQTIFYDGTRLHDGATIIRGDRIMASAVFYNPSTKAFTKKYGARHRAAIGISEVSDSVTVVVSEESGRISIAKDGNIEIIQKEKFKDIFRELLFENE